MSFQKYCRFEGVVDRIAIVSLMSLEISSRLPNWCNFPSLVLFQFAVIFALMSLAFGILKSWFLLEISVSLPHKLGPLNFCRFPIGFCRLLEWLKWHRLFSQIFIITSSNFQQYYFKNLICTILSSYRLVVSIFFTLMACDTLFFKK